MLTSLIRRFRGRCPQCGGRFRPLNPYALDEKIGEGWTYHVAKECAGCGWLRISASKTAKTEEGGVRVGPLRADGPTRR